MYFELLAICEPSDLNSLLYSFTKLLLKFGKKDLFLGDSTANKLLNIGILDSIIYSLKRLIKDVEFNISYTFFKKICEFECIYF